MKTIVLAAPKSGSGKTLVTLAMLRALTRRKKALVSAKIGPDYIDPAFHKIACRGVCFNIDPWAMDQKMQKDILTSLRNKAATRKDGVGLSEEFCLIEGVMGLFDGSKDGRGSTAEFAKKAQLPVVLIVDVKGQSASAAAIVKGFTTFDPDLNIGGVIFNNVGSDTHKKIIAQAMQQYLPNITVVGYLPRDKTLEMPDRHLGLVQAEELPDLEGFLDYAADWIEQSCDFEKLEKIAAVFNDSEAIVETENRKFDDRYFDPDVTHIAVARDIAFAFSYESLIERWIAQNIKVSFFSPLADEGPDQGADLIYLPGGYPELYGEKLSKNGHFKSEMNKAAQQGKKIFGECGGYMVLGSQIIDANGISHDMLGLLPLKTNFQRRKLHLGYRRIKACCSFAFGQKNEVFSAHEFHYATIEQEEIGNAERLFEMQDATGEDLGMAGLKKGQVAGSFMHLIASRSNDFYILR